MSFGLILTKVFCVVWDFLLTRALFVVRAILTRELFVVWDFLTRTHLWFGLFLPEAFFAVWALLTRALNAVFF